MALVRWDPFGEMLDVERRMRRLLPMWTSAGTREPLTWTPAVDVIRHGEDLLVRAELPGVYPDDIEVSIRDDMLTIAAVRRHEEKLEERDYLLHELEYGRFERTLSVPARLKTEEIHADFTDGILEITLPKAIEHEPKTHKVEVVAHETAHHEAA
jgi:HSP20 family protein